MSVVSVEKTTKFKVEEVVRKGLQNNKLKTLVFLFFNGINQEPFLNDNFNIKSKDFLVKIFIGTTNGTMNIIHKD